MVNVIFARTCQECGYIQRATKPEYDPPVSYLNTKCRKCSSPALDYGSESFHYDTNGKLVKAEIEE